MFSIILLLAIVCAIGSSSSRHHMLKKQSLRINNVGRDDWIIEKYPFQVAVLSKREGNTVLCGGTLLNKDSVLTAASCLKDSDTELQVRTGSSSYEEGGILTKVKSFKRHFYHNSSSEDYNIAVIKLEDRLEMNDQTKTVVLAESGHNLPVGTAVKVIGWGTTAIKGVLSPTLMTDQGMHSVSKEDCLKYYAASELSERMFCAGPDLCVADYGGPLLDADGVQYGIASYTKGCGKDDGDAPAIYTKVGDFRNFIYNVADPYPNRAFQSKKSGSKKYQSKSGL